MIKTRPNRISDVALLVAGFILFLTGLFLLIFPDAATMLNSKINYNLVSIVIMKFLGSAYALIGLLTLLFFNTTGIRKIGLLVIYNIISFVNLYLLLEMSNLISLDVKYYYLQAGFSILLFISLLDEFSQIRNK
jgi:hypothetical protein